MLCIYGIAKRIGGQIFAYWAVVLWLTVPFIGIKFTDYLYHQRYTELTLPQGFGLTAMADFPSMVAVLVAVYFGLRVLERPDAIEALASGLAAGVAITIKPASAPFSAVSCSASCTAAASPQLPIVAGLAGPPHLAPKPRLGYLPLFMPRLQRDLPSARSNSSWPSTRCTTTSSSTGTVSISTSAIEEHFWSLRVVEWLVIAGLIGLAAAR